MLPAAYLTSSEKKQINAIRKKLKKSKTREELSAYVDQLKLIHERIFIRYEYENKLKGRS